MLKSLLCAVAMMVLTVSSPLQQQKKYIVDVQAHRGGMGLYPEESLEAMLNAINLGVNTLEMDICVTKDKKVVLSHDKYFSHRFSTRPDGTPVLEGEPREYIWHMPYDSVAKYDVGLRRNPDMPEQQLIATPKRLLTDVVAAVEEYTKKNHLAPMNYNIEIKCDPDYDGGIEGRDWPEYHEFTDICMSVLDSLGLGDRLIIQTFDTRTLNYLNEAYPGHHLSYLVGGGFGSYEQFMDRLNFIPEWLSPAWPIIDKDMVSRAHADGMKIVTWTVDEKEQMRKVIEMGVEAVISNYPDRLLEVVAEY
jgi:glycerophosphoryl diester phosphodiesterase